MTWQRILILGLTVLSAVTLLAGQSGNGMRRWAAYEVEMQDPAEDPPDAYQDAEFAFARLRYRSLRRGRPSWGTDSNKAERQFVQGVRRLTRIHTRSVEEIVDVDSDEMFNWPWIYAVEVGKWELSEARRIPDGGRFPRQLRVERFPGEPATRVSR